MCFGLCSAVYQVGSCLFIRLLLVGVLLDYRCCCLPCCFGLALGTFFVGVRLGTGCVLLCVWFDRCRFSVAFWLISNCVLVGVWFLVDSLFFLKFVFCWFLAWFDLFWVGSWLDSG